MIRPLPGCRRLPIPPAAFLALLLAAADFAAPPALAAPPVRESTSYRRIFVPANSPETWPVGTARYLPIPKTEFDRLVTSASERQTAAAHGGPRINRMIHRIALVEAEPMLRGLTEVDVQTTDSHPGILLLQPWHMPIVSTYWSRDRSRPAQIALWNGRDESKRFGVWVDRSDTFYVQWELRGQHAGGSETVYTLEMPAAALQKLELTLPAKHLASIDFGQLLRKVPSDDGQQRWIFQLAPRDSYRLRVTKPSAAQGAQALPRVSQADTYRLRPEGLTLTSITRVDGNTDSRSQMRLALPAGMEIVHVKIDQAPVTWYRESDSGTPQLVVERPIAKGSQLIEVEGITSPKLDQLWELPSLRVHGVFWTAGSTRLLIAPSLELQSLRPQHATLQDIDGLANDAPVEEVFELRQSSPNSTIAIVLARRHSQLAVRSATVLKLGTDKATASTNAKIVCMGLGAFSVEAELGKGWSIESVTTVPKSALRDWHIYEANGRTLLRADLRRPIHKENPLRLKIDTQAIDGDFSLPKEVGVVKPISFGTHRVDRDLLLVGNRSIGEAELLHGLQTARLELDTLRPADRELLPKTAAGVLLDLGELSNNQLVELRQESPQYEADVAIEVSVLSDAVVHDYQLQCVPTSGALSELLVELDDELPESAEWTMEGRSGALVVERIEPAAAAGASDRQRFSYRIRFPSATTEPIRLLATYDLPAERLLRCNALRVPEATNSRGQITIRGPLDNVQLVDTGWVPAGWPAADKTGEPPLPLIGCYRLGANEAQRPSLANRLTLIRTGPGASIAKVSAWYADYVTLLSAGGTALYEICYYLDNSGSGEVEIVLPPDAQLQEAWQNSAQVDPSEALVGGRKCRFRLEANKRWQTLLVRYVAEGRALGQSTSIPANVPDCSFPIGMGRWTLSTPEQYELDAVVASRATDDLHWMRRLFGPLVRSRRASWFHPLHLEDWAQLWSAPIVGQRARQAAGQTARRLAAGLSMRSDENWGDLIRRVSRELDIEETLYIDRIALEALGIRSATSSALLRGAPMDSTTGGQGSASQLPSRGLALVVSPTAIILSDEQRVAHWRNDLRPTATPGVYSIVSDRLAKKVDLLATKFHSDIIPVSDWLSTPDRSELPWGARLNLLPEINHSAWTVEFVETPPEFVVYRGEARRALWHVVWLISMVLGTWLLRRRVDRLLLLIATFAAMCFVAPVHWLTIPQAALIGLLSAAILSQIVRHVRLVVRERLARPAAAQSSGVATAMLTGWVLLGSPSLSSSAEQQQTGPSVDQILARVLVPVDEHGQFQGEDVLVDESLLGRLRPAPSVSSRDVADYAVLSAIYRGELPHAVLGGEANDESGDIPPWSFAIDIDCFVVGSRLQLPFRKDDAQWLSDRHLLDGRPTELAWDEQGCSLELRQAGRHRLELFGIPVFSSDAERERISMRVPMAPIAKVEFSSGNGVRDLRIVGAGQLAFDESSGRHSARLAPGKPLSVSWIADQGEASPVVFDQLSWLHVTPSTAHVDVQLILRQPSEFPQRFEVAVANDLKLVPLESDSPIERVASAPGTLQFRRKSESVIPDRIFLRFQLQRIVSIGQIPYPLVRLKNSMANRSLFAVSVSSGLSFDDRLSGEMRSIAATEFAREWAADREAPLYAYSVADRIPDWSLRIWPDPTASTVRQNVDVHCHRQGARVEFEVNFDHVTGQLFVCRLGVPQELRIDGVSIAGQPDLAQTELRWSRVNDTEVSVFLGQPLQSSQVLTLHGWMDGGEGNAFSLPKISLLSEEHNEVTINLYRHVDVLVDVEDADGQFDRLARLSTTQRSEEILVGRYAWRAGITNKAPTLRLRNNEPRFRADTLLTVQRSDAEESAVLHARIRMTDGVRSQFRISAPSAFESPYRLRPANVGTVTEAPRPGGSREVTIRLARPARAGDEIEFSLAGRLGPRADQLLEVPNVKLLDAGRHRQYVLLPTRLGDQQINWQRPVGLRRRAIPSSMRALIDPQSRPLPHRVEQEPFMARQQSKVGPLRRAALRYAIGSGTIDALGHFSATVELVVQPGRETHCTVRMPSDARLLQLVVGDRRVRQKRAHAGQWRVPLGPPFMPRKIFVTYQTDNAWQQTRLQPPMPDVLIGDQMLPLDVAFWRITPVGGLRMGGVVTGNRISREQFLEASDDYTLRTVEDSRSLALELPEKQRQAWFQSWATPGRREGPALHRVEGGSEVANALAPLEYPPQLPARPSSAFGDRATYYQSDSAGRLSLSAHRPGLHHVWRWLAAVVMVASSVVSVRRLGANPNWYDRLSQWPHAMTFGLGAVWWAVLQPSAIGLLIIALATCSLLRQQTRRLRQRRL